MPFAESICRLLDDHLICIAGHIAGFDDVALTHTTCRQIAIGNQLLYGGRVQFENAGCFLGRACVMCADGCSCYEKAQL